MEAASKIIFTKFAQPAKSKLQLYQIVLQTYVNQILALVVSKYLFCRIKLQETTKDNTVYYEKFEYTVVKLKDKAGYYFVKLQSMHEECLTHEETPSLFCEPHIHTGFRPINKPYSYYIKSVLKKHNETVNALSHYFGALYCLIYFYRFDFTDKWQWPLLSTVITSIFMFLSSASAHLLHQKSHYCHMTCFLFDFTGISVHCFSAALLQSFYCSPSWYYTYIEPIYLIFLGLCSILCCLMNSFAQVNYKRPYPPIKRFLQFAPLGITWIFTMLPLVLAFITNDNDFKIDFKLHFVHIILFLTGAVFFGGDIPQRFFPGRFDFFGQGHHIFHICIFFVTVFQIEACYNDFKANYDKLISTRTMPTFEMCFLSVFVLLIYDLIIIKSCRNMIAHNFDDMGNMISKKPEDYIDMSKLD